ncbi:MAG: hypothetical protein M3P45_01300 [Acidobacteriota bacterium]|nr:hypothetical protein [Acidobacteriota bacterium]
MAQPGPAPIGSTSDTITVNADGTYSPSSISINNGGVAKFDVTYPAGMTVCNIAIGGITFSVSDDATTGGTVKIGS